MNYSNRFLIFVSEVNLPIWLYHKEPFKYTKSYKLWNSRKSLWFWFDTGNSILFQFVKPATQNGSVLTTGKPILFQLDNRLFWVQVATLSIKSLKWNRRPSSQQKRQPEPLNACMNRLTPGKSHSFFTVLEKPNIPNLSLKSKVIKLGTRSVSSNEKIVSETNKCPLSV